MAINLIFKKLSIIFNSFQWRERLTGDSHQADNDDHEDLHLDSSCWHHFLHSAGLLVTSRARPPLGALTSEGSRVGKVYTNASCFARVDSKAMVYLEAAVAYPRLTTRGTSECWKKLHTCKWKFPINFKKLMCKNVRSTTQRFLNLLFFGTY